MPNDGTETNTDAAAIAAAAAEAAGSQSQGDGEALKGSGADTNDDAFAGLETDNREWLTKQGFITDGKADLTKLGKQVYQQEKLLGGAIRIPGKDATPEERDAFLNKLGRPETPDKYEFTVPKDLPEELPYDGEGAKEYGSKAHELGLTKTQAAGLHDWWAGKQVEAAKGLKEAEVAQKTELAKKSATDLATAWGPLDGETAKANLQFADRVLDEAEPGTLEELQGFGILGPNKEVLSSGLAKLFAKVGTALFKEDGVLKGNSARIGNPFEGGNLTEQMAAYKNDPELAYSLISAAGKKPEDFGLKAR